MGNTLRKQVVNICWSLNVVRDRKEKMKSTEKSSSQIKQSNAKDSFENMQKKSMRCGELNINLEFADTNRTIGDCLWNVLCRLQE